MTSLLLFGHAAGLDQELQSFRAPKAHETLLI
jgi:hypothetical protein